MRIGDLETVATPMPPPEQYAARPPGWDIRALAQVTREHYGPNRTLCDADRCVCLLYLLGRRTRTSQGGAAHVA